MARQFVDWDSLEPKQQYADYHPNHPRYNFPTRCHAAFPVGRQGNHTWMTYRRCRNGGGKQRFCPQHRPKSLWQRIKAWLP